MALSLLVLLVLSGVLFSDCGARAADRMQYLDNGHIRIGSDLDLGGAITYLSRSGSGVNLINNHDWGRQVQMSFYSGPVPFAPHGKTPSPTWAGLGWNPIQSGDCFGHRSRVVASRSDSREMYVKCIPMQWPLDNEPGDCTFETWIRLEGATAHVRCRLINDRTDSTQYPARDQELPALYTNGPWDRLMTYTGDAPFTGGGLTQMPGRFPWTGWHATENWAALVNADGWGLGVWQPETYSFIGGFFGTAGVGGPQDSPTGYIAPVSREILDRDIRYEYQYVLILGSLAEIRGYIYAHASKPAPPAYRFAADRQHWRYVGASDAGWPIREELRVRLERDDPQLIGPPGFWTAVSAPRLYIRAAFHTSGRRAQIFWSRHDAPGFAEARSVRFDVRPDGRFHTYEVDLAASPEYRGAITGLRLDPEDSGRTGDYVRVRSVGFRRPD